MRRIVIGFIALLCCAPAFAQPTPGLLKAESTIDKGTLSDTTLWFTLTWVDQKFVADAAAVPDAQALFQALIDANHQGRAVAVWYDPDTAGIDFTAMKPTFVMRKVVIDGKTYVGDEKTPAHLLPPNASPADVAENALARGIAYAGAGQPKIAAPLLDRALTESGMVLPLKVLGLKARCILNEDRALNDFLPGEARDAALIVALQDARAWRAAAPTDADAALEEAYVLGLLGAYDEALAIYMDAQTRWPDQAYLTLRRIAMIYRDTGRLKEAGEWLDKWAEQPDATSTMPYRFHRARLFDELGQPEAAIVEYTEGMKIQPDYEGAFWRRSCSYAAAGHIREALDDFRAMEKIRAGYFQGGEPSPAAEFDAKRRAEVGQILEKTLADDPHRKVSGLCQGYWDGGDSKRERSKLLPVAP